jgi:hypothetical protein
MDKKLTQITLANVCRGAAPQLFEHEFRRVLANIQDVNTDPLEERSIVLKIRFKPSKSREEAMTRIDVTAKLAGTMPVTGHMFMGRDDPTDAKSPIIAAVQDVRQEILPLEEPKPAEAEPAAKDPQVTSIIRAAAE